MSMVAIVKYLEPLQRIAWVLFLVCLPVTSFPYFPTGFGGGTLVRPLSLYPLLILLCIYTIPRLLTRPIPKTIVIIFPLLLMAIISTSLSITRDIEPALGVSVVDRALRGLVTLLVGIAIYVTVALVPSTFNQLRNALRSIYAGFAVALLWGSFQSIYIINYQPGYFHKINALQKLISIRKLFPTRISGLTYEPNWFAEQISILFLPWLIASVISGYSLFKWRFRWITIEGLLLAWAIINLAFTYSRAGFINFIFLSLVALILFHPKGSRKMPKIIARLPLWVRKISTAIVLLVLILAAIYVIGHKNNFFSRIWNFWSERSDTSLASYIEYLGFGSRVAYLETAYYIYESQPFLGVGLGNFAFYFDEMYPDRPLAPTPELLRILTPESGSNRLITPKNVYGRLLSETGLAGLATFLVFLVALFGCVLYMLKSSASEQRYWGIAGLLGFLVVMVSAISYDSFAIPNMWVVFGLITASASISNQVLATNPTPQTQSGII